MGVAHFVCCQLHSVSFGPNSLLARISRYLRVALILFAGKWGLPIPHRVPLVIAIGRPMELEQVENPSDELVNRGVCHLVCLGKLLTITAFASACKVCR